MIRRWSCLFLLLLFLFPAKETSAQNGNWIMQKQEWTYVDEYEKVIPGWVKYKEYWYYIDPARECMLTGWLLYGGKWYFLSNRSKSLGKMYCSWCIIDGYAYYFDENGAMAEKTTVQGKYPVNENGQFIGEDGKAKYYEKSNFRTKPSTVMDELMAKAEKEQEQLSIPRIAGIGNPTFITHFGYNPNGTFDPGPQNPWANKEYVDMRQYDMKEIFPEEVPDPPDYNDYEEEETEEEDNEE